MGPENKSIVAKIKCSINGFWFNVDLGSVFYVLSMKANGGMIELACELRWQMMDLLTCQRGVHELEIHCISKERHIRQWL